MQNKCIFIILDGLSREVAEEQLGYMNHLVEYQQATIFRGWAETPSNSRPMYEVLHTGVPTYKNGITTNHNNHNSKENSIFHQLKQAGKKTGASAYHWISELYNFAPYNPMVHRIQLQSAGLIDNGIFYSEDDYPDSHVFADAHYILSTCAPDYMLVHSMNIDHMGHLYGGQSKAYRQAANKADILLATFIPQWLEMGYQIVVSSDHGMDEWGLHGGSSSEHRATSIFVLSERLKKGDYKNIEVKHLELSSFLAYLLGLKSSAPEMMKNALVNK
jgi:predicted AlkP superfamily pyrophosphatase or phosphodiesterase